jgi:hypothetical protein
MIILNNNYSYLPSIFFQPDVWIFLFDGLKKKPFGTQYETLPINVRTCPLHYNHLGYFEKVPPGFVAGIRSTLATLAEAAKFTIY